LTNHVDRHTLVEKLKQVGVSGKTIRELLANHPLEKIQGQLEMLPYRNANKNPAGFLVQAIKGDWSVPAMYLQMQVEEQKRALEVKQAEEEHTQKLAKEAKQKEYKQKLLAKEKQLSSFEKSALLREAAKRVRQRIGKSWPKEKPIPPTFLKAEFNALLASKH